MKQISLRQSFWRPSHRWAPDRMSRAEIRASSSSGRDHHDRLARDIPKGRSSSATARSPRWAITGQCADGRHRHRCRRPVCHAGIIDPHSHIAILGGVNEGTLAVTSMTAIEDVLDPTDISIYRSWQAGYYHAHAARQRQSDPAPAPPSNCAGAGRQGPPLQEPTGAENSPWGKTSSAAARRALSASRMGTEDVIRTAFIEAREYSAAGTRLQEALCGRRQDPRFRPKGPDPGAAGESPARTSGLTSAT